MTNNKQDDLVERVVNAMWDVPIPGRTIQDYTNASVMRKYRTLARAAINAMQPVGWQPIETAPKDGTRFWGKDGDDAIAMLWHSEFDAFVSSWREMTFAKRYGGGTRLHSPEKHYPTHWMPLTALPQEATQ